MQLGPGGQGPSQRQNLQWVLGCPMRTLSDQEEDAPWRQRRRRDWLLMPPHSPNPGTTGSMAFSFLSTQREMVNFLTVSKFNQTKG